MTDSNRLEDKFDATNKTENDLSGTPLFEPGIDKALSSEMISVATSKATALDSFINSLTQDIKFNDFIKEMLLSLIRAVKCEAGSILEVDHKNQTIFFRAVEGSSSDQLMDFIIPIGSGIVGHVIESRQPLTVQNLPENKEHLASIAKTIGFEARNLIAIPIIIRGKVYGVVELLNRIGEENFTASDIELVSYLAQMAGKTIEIRLMLAWSQKKETQIPSEAA